jgi:hypothetical protein
LSGWRRTLRKARLGNRDHLLRLLREPVDQTIDRLDAAFLTRSEKPDHAQIRKEPVGV